MGGLRRQMPVTFACMFICTLAIAGVPYFSGFYSKDAILLSGWAGILGDHFDGWKVYATVGLSVAATMTAFYMFRMVFITFFGTYRGEIAEGHGHGHDDHHDDHHHEEIVHAEDGGIAHGHPGPMPHESPLPMTAALVVLAFFGFFAGDFPFTDLRFWDIYHPQTWFESLASLDTLYPNVSSWLDGRFAHSQAIHDAAHSRAFYGSVFVIAPLGIFLGWLLYMRRKEWPAKITGGLGLIYHTVRDRYYVDEFVNAAVIKPTMACAGLLKLIDERIVDGLVLLVGRINKFLGFFSAAFDRIVVDGLVNFVGLASQTFGAVSRLLQTGRIQQYAAFAVAGGLLVAAWLILS